MQLLVRDTAEGRGDESDSFREVRRVRWLPEDSLGTGRLPPRPLTQTAVNAQVGNETEAVKSCWVDEKTEEENLPFSTRPAAAICSQPVERSQTTVTVMTSHHDHCTLALWTLTGKIEC